MEQKEIKFKVTKKAMRPVSIKKECFYCQQPIGSYHKNDCVLIQKDVIIRAVIEYKIQVPNDWDKEMIEFNRNEGTWCSSNMIDELKALEGRKSCLCRYVKWELVKDKGNIRLDE